MQISQLNLFLKRGIEKIRVLTRHNQICYNTCIATKTGYETMSFNKARKTIEWHNEGHQLTQWAKADYETDSQHNNYEITGNGNPTTMRV